jgi:hypothetical protein
VDVGDAQWDFALTLENREGFESGGGLDGGEAVALDHACHGMTDRDIVVDHETTGGRCRRSALIHAPKVIVTRVALQPIA